MLKKTSICLIFIIIFSLVIFNFFKAEEVEAASFTYGTPGNYTYTVPAGIDTITVETWGAGGAGGGSADPRRRSGKGGAGGGGGAYARSELNVEAIDTLYIIVGAGGVGVNKKDGTDGNPSFVGLDANQANALVLAAPGLGGGSNTKEGRREPGQGGSIADSIGDIRVAGKDGETGGGCCNVCSGAGGKGAEGGVGGAAICATCSDGNPGERPGGGGGGSVTTGGRSIIGDNDCPPGTGGDGASGKVMITEIAPDVTYELTIDSTSGGEVTVPGEGTFIIAGGRVVDLKAVADSENIFTNWTGDIGTIANTGSAITKITMNNNYSITANFGCSLPSEPILVSPGDLTTEVAPYTPNFRWLDSDYESSYEIQLSKDIAFKSSDKKSLPADTEDVDWWGAPLSKGVYYWRVFAINICGTAESETFTFTVEAPVTCWDPTPHFASGCAMLLHYDTNNDGVIDTDEVLAAVNDYNNGKLTLAEIYFIVDTWEVDEINIMCPGCYEFREEYTIEVRISDLSDTGATGRAQFSFGAWYNLPASERFLEGEEATIRARGSLGYEFESWASDPCSGSTYYRCDFTVTQDETLYVVLVAEELEQYDLNITVDPAGSGTTTPLHGITHTYDAGTVVNLAAQAEPGYQFVNWTGDTGTIANINASSTTITMNGDYSITAEFVPFPTVDLKVNGSDGPITIVHNTPATLSWTSTDAVSCTASGAWLGNRATDGLESTGNLTSASTYILTCTGPGGSASDSVTVNVSTDLPPTARMECQIIYCNGPGCVCSPGLWEMFVKTNYRINNTSSEGDNAISTSSWSVIGKTGYDKTFSGINDYGLVDISLLPLELNYGDNVMKLEVRDTIGLSDTVTNTIRVKRDTKADFECSLTGDPADYQGCGTGFEVMQGDTVYFRGDDLLDNLSRPSYGANQINPWRWEKGYIDEFGVFVFEESFGGNSAIASTTLTRATSTVRLIVTDNHNEDLCYDPSVFPTPPGCQPAGRSALETKTLNIKLPLPDYREVRPRSQLDNFLARIAGMFR